MNDIVLKLTQLFRDVLDNEKIVLDENTTASDIEEWDSLSHIHLVVEIENHFNISFTSAEMQSWKTIGDLAAHIAAKINA